MILEEGHGDKSLRPPEKGTQSLAPTQKVLAWPHFQTEFSEAKQ